jgi:hypothetical protein
MGRLRRRLDGLEQHAHQTMTGADQLVVLAKDFVSDLADGVQIEIEVKRTGNLFFDAILEKWGWKIPFTLRIDPREKESES